jgi:phosphoketolase
MSTQSLPDAQCLPTRVNCAASRLQDEELIGSRAKLFREADPLFAQWAAGLPMVEHSARTQVLVYDMADLLVKAGKAPSLQWVFDALIAADRLCSMGMWLVAHMTYAQEVDLEGRELSAKDFKLNPEGHTGGSLNMVQAYVGYLTANLLSGVTRSWIMGQGHCVAAIEAVNVLISNLTPEQHNRYAVTNEGLTRLVQDFYSYQLTPDGKPAAPIGSHVNAHTAGGVIEGGYLGFAEVQYVHMPLPGERLVAFLSDGAFEEQRGSDWSPRWWRAEDCGLVLPIMILNGRRIEQRSEVALDGGAKWLEGHLRQNGFDPFEIDGRDPAAICWSILEMEARLGAGASAIAAGRMQYPVALPYAIARTIKGFGFPGAGTNRAHNLPLDGTPAYDEQSRLAFNAGAKALWVEPALFSSATTKFSKHDAQKRPLERLHPLAVRDVAIPQLPPPQCQTLPQNSSPMDALDRYFVEVVKANPQLRPRVGNPDELQSNRMGETLKHLKHRVNRPEPGVHESVLGGVITALNEEAVIGATLGNKGGLNIAVSYEAFAVKMLGALRQDIIFARHQKEAGRPPGWISVPLIVTSHTWENGKNELSHQDTTIGEALLSEMADVARVIFPIDGNSAVSALRNVYAHRGQIACLVVPKRDVPLMLSGEQAEQLMTDGAIHIQGSPDDADLQIVAIGAYQLREALRAAERLTVRGYRVCVTCIIEPGRFRVARDEFEAVAVVDADQRARYLPETLRKVVVCHTRPQAIAGLWWDASSGARAHYLGFNNQGGTLDVFGMLFANKATWAHIAQAAAAVLGSPISKFLDEEEQRAVEGSGNPRSLA